MGVAKPMIVGGFRGTLVALVFLSAAGWLSSNAGGGLEASQKPEATAASKVDFARDIQPLLEKSCYSCHGEKLQMGGLRLDSRKLALEKVIQPGKGAGSLLYQRIAGLSDQPRMPMGADPLDSATIERVRSWIDQGADWPEGIGAQTAETKKHWAYVPPSARRCPR